jgi:hypothetical protein
MAANRRALAMSCRLNGGATLAHGARAPAGVSRQHRLISFTFVEED